MISLNKTLALMLITLLINQLLLLEMTFATSLDIHCKVVVINEGIIRIDKGHSSGIKTNHTAIVIRDGTYIALIQIVSVRENTSVAKILETKSETVNISAGDEVIVGEGKQVDWKNKLLEEQKTIAEAHFNRGEYEKAYQLYKEILKLSPDDDDTKRRLRESDNLRPKYGMLTISSDPSGANIYLNDNFIGTTPFDNKKLIGDYNLRISSASWQDEIVEISILENKNTVVNCFLKKPLDINLQPQDVGRIYKRELTFTPRQTHRKEPLYTATGFVISVGIAVGAFAGASSIDNTFNDEGREVWPTSKWLLVITGGLSSLYAIGALTSPDKTQEKAIPENIEYNEKEKARIERRNRAIRAYNAETERLLEAKRAEEKEKAKEFNENRQTTVEIKK